MSPTPGGKEGTYPSLGLGTERSSCSRPPHRDSSTPCKSPDGPGGVDGTQGPGPPPASIRPGPHLGGGGAGIASDPQKTEACVAIYLSMPPYKAGPEGGAIRTQAVALVGHASALGGVQH